MRFAFLVGLTIVVLATLGVTWRTLHSLSLRNSPAPATHVVLSSDASELRPLYIAIKSTLIHVNDPTSLQFHIITSPELQQIYTEILRRLLPAVHLEVHTNPRVLAKIRDYITYRASSKVEQEMANLFRFVPFFLPEFLEDVSFSQEPRLVYLDTDSVLLGDVTGVAKTPLRGHAVAAPRDCSHELRELIDFSLVRRFGAEWLNPKECPLSRGLMVIDPLKWQALNVSGNLLEWLRRYREQPLLEDLWEKSLDIAPLMLSLTGFRRLSSPWSCVNLGEEELPPSSTKELLNLGFDHQDLQKMARTVTSTGSLRPPVHPCTATSHLLHFGGPMKPWLDSEVVQPVCVLPNAPPPKRGWSKLGDPGYTLECQVKAGRVHLVNCSMLWWAFLTEDEDCALKGYEQWPTQPRTQPSTTLPPTPKAETTVDPMASTSTR